MPRSAPRGRPLAGARSPVGPPRLGLQGDLQFRDPLEDALILGQLLFQGPQIHVLATELFDLLDDFLRFQLKGFPQVFLSDRIALQFAPHPCQFLAPFGKYRDFAGFLGQRRCHHLVRGITLADLLSGIRSLRQAQFPFARLDPRRKHRAIYLDTDQPVL